MTTKELIETLQKIETEHGVLHVYVETTTKADIRDEANMLVSGMNASADECKVEPSADEQKAVWITGAVAADEQEED